MSAGEGPIVQMALDNERLTLARLEQIYLPAFPEPRARNAVLSLLELVHSQCIINPVDMTLQYPDGRVSISTLGELLHYFACGKKISEMPPDAPTFLAFLKHNNFVTSDLCMIHIDA